MSQEFDSADITEEVHWDGNGLIPAIAQDAHSQRILMMAWMNRDALLETAQTGVAVYWSRSRQRLWRKGEESGHIQKVHSIRTDCDKDVILLSVTQYGLACHTGRESCFFEEWHNGHWIAIDPVRKDPKEIYK